MLLYTKTLNILQGGVENRWVSQAYSVLQAFIPKTSLLRPSVGLGSITISANTKTSIS